MTGTIREVRDRVLRDTAESDIAEERGAISFAAQQSQTSPGHRGVRNDNRGSEKTLRCQKKRQKGVFFVNVKFKCN